jgi:ABC-type transporter Mla subunit MlaD
MNGLNRTAQRIGIDPRALAGLGVLLVGALLWVLAFTGGIASIFGGSTTTVRADFASIEDIVTNDPVRVDGVQVGSVGGSRTDPAGRGATLTLNLDSNAPAIYRNASASIVWRTALGANDAVQLNPGTRSAGLLGNATIPQSQDQNQVELDQITQAAFHGGAQQGLRTMLQQLAPALHLDHAVLNNDFSTLARIGPQASIGIGAVRGAIQDTDLRNLVLDTSRAAEALSVGTGASTTRAFVQSAASTLSALSANQVDLRESITQLATTEHDVITIYPKIHDTLNRANVLIPRLLPSAPRVGPTLAELQPVVTNLDTLLRNATPLLDRLRPTVYSLARTATVGIPVVDQLNPSLVQLQNKVLPGLDIRGPENGGLAVYQEIGPVITGLGTLSHFFDSNGNLGNLTVGGQSNNQSSQSLLPCNIDFSGKDLLVCETLSQALSTYTNLGTSFLQSLRRTSAGSTLGSAIDKMIGANSAFAHAEAKLTSADPTLGKWLFNAAHGGLKLK